MFEDIFRSSASVSLLGLVFGLLVLVVLYSNSKSHEGREPPGPRPLPLIGNLLQVDLKKVDQSLLDLSKKYGPVFQIYFGIKKIVVLAGYRTVKQALVNHADEFGNREITPIFYDFNKEHGILFSNGESWKEMRRFALTTLKDFGMGKRIIEDKIIEECHYLIEDFETFEGKPFDNTKTISYAASNVISSLMFGKRFEFKDPIFQAMVERDNETIHLTGSVSIQLYNFFPWLGPFLKNRRDVIRNVEAGKSDIRQIVADLRETLDPQMCRCFVDAFLIRTQNLEENGIKNSHYHDDNLVESVANLFAAGTDTTATTLKWCLLYMAKYPHVQDQVVEELNRVVGSRQVRIDDRKNLPYTDAVIHESQRLANIVPMSIPHTTERDVTFQGHFIKKGTTVLPLLTSVLYDESEWENPHTFTPSHFLDHEGKFIKRDAFMPFSAGRRACLGEGLARMELFLFFASLLQCFRFTPPPGVSEDELDLAPVVGFTLSPLPQSLCAVRRQ
ncbi:cytochrome P450 2K1-like isoform 2-T2 [Menidia menidia]